MFLFRERIVCHLSLADPDESERSLFAMSIALSFFCGFCDCFLERFDLNVIGEESLEMEDFSPGGRGEV